MFGGRVGGTRSQMSRYPNQLDTSLDWLFGDGSDGDVTISSNTTLTFRPYYNSLTVNAGFTLFWQGFIFVRNLLTLAGTISVAGNNAVGSVGGGASNVGEFRKHDGGNGGTGVGSGGQASTAIIAASPVCAGSAGGAGSSGAGGAGGAVTDSNTRIRDPISAIVALSQILSSTNKAAVRFSSGSGGGGGGGDGVNAGGGGGGGASLLVIVAREIVWSGAGIITAAGGNGANAAAGNAGGGGGGGGGVIILVRRGISPATLIAGTHYSVAGGQKGNGIGTGVNGTLGNDGLFTNIAV